MRKVLIMHLICVFCVATADAQLTTDVSRLIVNYMKAMELKDSKAIDTAWTALSKFEKALNLLKKDYPRVYRSYEYWRIKKELEALKAKRFINASFTTPQTQEGSFSTSRDVNRSNSKRVRDYPNQKARSNRSRVMAYPNQNRRSNQDTVSDIPNQELLSNQERIRNRLRSVR